MHFMCVCVCKIVPISSSSRVMDLERRAKAGGVSRLLCWGTKGKESTVTSNQKPSAMPFIRTPTDKSTVKSLSDLSS